MALKDLITTPTYTITLPSNNKKIKIRPFLVKEEKVLLIAKQTKDLTQIYDAIKSVIISCVQDETLNIDSLPYFDVEYLFLQLRAKSMGEKVEILVTDPASKQKFDSEINLEQVFVENLNLKNNNKFKLRDDLAVELTYPNFSKLKDMTINFLKNTEQKVSLVFETLVLCLNKVYTKDQVIDCSTMEKKEIEEFLESLSSKEFGSLVVFLNNMPRLKYKSIVKNPMTGNDVDVEIEDFDDFFL